MIAINIPGYVVNSDYRIPENFCHIAISDNGAEPYKINGDPERILQVHFDDVNDKFFQHGRENFPITQGVAKEIIEFALKNLDKNFIVNCTAGVSRSSAVCLFLNICFGHDLKESFWQTSNPNAFVLGLLIRDFKSEINRLFK